MGEDEWEIYQTDEVAAWMTDLRRIDPQAAEKVEAAVDVLAEYGSTLGRPLVDTLTGSKLANLKELRPRQTNIRVLFVFDPWRSAILLVAGDKTGQWQSWYERSIPQAERLYAVYLEERAKAEEEAGD
ncbi:MAG TPA: type II toxin-antitoxin system RelE/ParE family toxin [Trebonia sp.]